MDTHDMMDRDGYPTEKFYKWAESIKWEYDGLMDITQTIIDCWHMADWGVYLKGKYRGHRTLYLHTGGWSGNEDIIAAMRDTMWWTLCWRNHIHGGHYAFSIPCDR